MRGNSTRQMTGKVKSPLLQRPGQLDAMMAIVRSGKKVVRVIRMEPEWQVARYIDLPKDP